LKRRINWLGKKNNGKLNKYFSIISSSISRIEKEKEHYDIGIIAETKETMMKIDCIVKKEGIESISLTRYIKNENNGHNDQALKIKMPNEIISKISIDNLVEPLAQWMDNKHYLHIDPEKLDEICSLISKEIRQEFNKAFPTYSFQFFDFFKKQTKNS